jgi:hypothetical protein
MKSRVFAALLVSPFLFACSKETPPSAEQPRTAASPPKGTEGATATPTETKPAETTDTPQPSGNASAKVEESNFALALSSKGAYTAGKAGEAEIVLEAKDPYKVNDKYPYKFKLADSDGVTYPDKIVTKDHVKLEHKKATMTVAFTPAGAGKKKISGVFHFSVCTEDKCLIEKRDLALDVDVK